MPFSSRFLRSLPFLLLPLIAGCPEPAPTEPPAQDETQLGREWEFFTEQHGESELQPLGDFHLQDLGDVSEAEEFGTLLTFPQGRDPIGKAEVFSKENGETYWAQAQAPFAAATNGFIDGAGAGLLQVNSYVIDSTIHSLKFTVTGTTLEGMDFTPQLPTPAQCLMDPDDDIRTDCTPPIEALIKFGIWANPIHESEILSRQSQVQLGGYIEHWDTPEIITEDGDNPVFLPADFEFAVDLDGGNTATHARLKLKAPIVIEIPSTSMDIGDTIIVKTLVLAAAVDRRQAETFSGAYFRDPATPVGVRVEAIGLHRIASAIDAPHVQLPAPACSGGNGTAGALQFSGPEFVTSEGGIAGALVTVSRAGGTTGLVSATVTSSGGTAAEGTDYTPITTVIRFGDGETGLRAVSVPVHSDSDIEDDETINLTLSDPRGCATLGGQNSTVLTIRDDDDQPAPPSQFSIGGTVTGLVGSGLVLQERNSGFESRPAGDGPFTIVPSRADGFAYDVIVETQPSNPLQSCAVTDGAGTLAGADVTNIVVTCTTSTATGTLDPTFGTGGRVTSTLVGGATAMALQDNGKIVIVGESKVQRFNDDGTPDQSFGAGGQADFVFPKTTAPSLPQGIAIQENGKIVVVGYVTDTLDGLTRNDFAVARYNANGTPDGSFGTAGQVIVDFASASARGWAVALQTDGRIVVAGQAAFPRGPFFDNDFAVARLTEAGLPDATFGDGGTTTTTIGGDADIAFAVGIQNDHKIVAAGRAAVDGGSNPDMALVRYKPDGSLDSTFNNVGITQTDQPELGAWQEAFDMVIQPDGGIVVAGQAQVGPNFNYLIARFATGGGLDGNFGTAGVTTTPFTTQGDVGRGIALHVNGGFVVAGRTAIFGSSDFGVARYTNHGLLDTTFGDDGLVVVDFLSGSDGAEAVAAQPDGKIVVAGFAKNGTSTGAGLARIAP